MRDTLRRCGLLATAGLNLYCATSSDDSRDPPVTDVQLTVTVSDSTGAPLPAVPLSVAAYRDTQVIMLAFFAATDSLGQLKLIDTLGRAGEPPDSFLVLIPEYSGGLCNPFETQERIVRRRLGQDSLSVALDAELIAPLAPVVPGEWCGTGVGPIDILLGSPFFVHLQVDSITDSIRGRWSLEFLVNIPFLGGTFSGPVRSDSLALDLANTILFPPPACTPGFRLSGPVSAGVSRLVRLVDQSGCGWSSPSSDTPFWVIVFDSYYFP